MRRSLTQTATVFLALVVVAACGPARTQATTIPAGALDMTGGSSAEITFPGGDPVPAYSPKLLAIGRAGTGLGDVQWSGSSFGAHPLRFEDSSVAGQSSGSTTTRNLRSGRYAFYCAIHGGPGGSGMSGEVYVAGPRAALRSVPADVAPGGTVTLDAAASDLVAHPGAGGLTYAFDPEGDGTFLAAGSATSVQATYPAQGTVTARVRVTDAAGRVDEAAFDVDVAPPGTTPPPAPGPSGDPTGPGSPSTTTGPGSTTKPDGAKPRRAARFADVATLPVLGHCVDRRRGVRVRVRDAKGADVRSVRVLVDGRTARRRTVKQRATLTIRPLPGVRPLVKVVVTLAGGRRLSRTTRYRVCRG